MDLTLNDDQIQIAELAGRILADQCSADVLASLESSDDRLASAAWAALAEADLLQLSLPEEHGGSGLGVLEAALIAQQVGRHVALVPYWTWLAGALTVARWGSSSQRDQHLGTPVQSGGRPIPLAVALWQPAGQGTSEAPAVTAASVGDGYRLDGIASPVPWAGQARALVVLAELAGDGPAAFLVPAEAAGLAATDQHCITRTPTQALTFNGVNVDQAGFLGGDEVVRWLRQRTAALLLSTTVGVCEGALALTAEHVSTRQQFGTPIGTFQAVAHRCADAYIDTEAQRLTTLQALWRLDAGLDAEDALDVAALWACEGGQRVVHAAQHLHGGIGVDTSYPVHRYFRWAKVLELLLGGVHSAVSGIGSRLATGGVSPVRGEVEVS